MSRYHDTRLTTRQAWVALACTVSFEVGATLLTKASDGFTRLGPSVGAITGFAITTLLLAKVLEVIPTSVAYTVWTGSGSALVVLVGAVVFGQDLSARAILGVGLVVAGVTILNFAGTTPAEPPV